MSRTHPQRTKDAIDKRQKQDFCNDCDRYCAFCDGRRIWFNDEEYWVCERCIGDGRPDQEEQDEQQSILQFVNAGDSDD